MEPQPIQQALVRLTFLNAISPEEAERVLREKEADIRKNALVKEILFTRLMFEANLVVLACLCIYCFQYGIAPIYLMTSAELFFLLSYQLGCAQIRKEATHIMASLRSAVSTDHPALVPPSDASPPSDAGAVLCPSQRARNELAAAWGSYMTTSTEAQVAAAELRATPLDQRDHSK